MYLKLTRMTKTNGAVIGQLEVDGAFECYTLEDPDGAGDRINAGTYIVLIDDSTRFKRKMPHVIGNAAVDDRGIRIHAGNTEADTVGCILVGQEHTSDALQLSKAAFDALFLKLESAQARGEKMTLEVLDQNVPAPVPSNPILVSPSIAPRPDSVLSRVIAALQSLLSVVRPS